jgi:carboxyl-terminal processing protease
MTLALRALTTCTLAISLAWLSLSTAHADNQPPAVPLKAIQDFVSVYERVRTEHVENHTDEQLLEKALTGLLLELDPYSEYLDAEATQALEEATSGSYVGIGVEIEPAGHHIIVVTPLDNSPASRAGIKAGDLITHINQRHVKGLDRAEISRLITGPEGSSLHLRLLRNGQELSFTIQRKRIQLHSVRSELKHDNVGYLRISQFQEHTATELQEQMQDLLNQGAEAWLLDLRNNPGGLIDSGVAVADAFLSKGIIVTTKGRQEYNNFIYEADEQDYSDKLPTLVMINRGSASAAEIVAAALQDNRRAELIGEQSFGKGSVQSLIALDDKRSIKLTTAYYYTPKGKNLNNTGISPDTKLTIDTDSDADKALELALKHLQKQL